MIVSNEQKTSHGIPQCVSDTFTLFILSILFYLSNLIKMVTSVANILCVLCANGTGLCPMYTVRKFHVGFPSLLNLAFACSDYI